MLFNARTLKRIETGEITLAFRVWRKPTVRQGGSLRTPVGVLAIGSVTELSADDISDDDVETAGFRTRDELLSSLEPHADRALYRIEFGLAGADPRVALREDDRLSSLDVEAIRTALDRLDDLSPAKPWTMAALSAIADKDGCTAAEISSLLGMEKLALKRNIRKLKELGLTESLQSGYRLSPRGRALLRAL
ncbi:MAG: hypothetical protein DI629_05510 [Mesorhizobium amorphae]|nr:MAG: hypothetical protein DI629_05510 [Mesorhizobium amorphae]